MQASNIDYAFSKTRINEEFFEDVVVEHLRDKLGYTYLHGPDVRRTSDKYDDVFLPDVLPRALSRINKGVPEAAIQEAILKISNVEGDSLQHRNETFMDYLQNGVEVRYFDGEEERDDIIYLIDYRDPETHEPHEYYCKLPESIDERIAVIVDPMLATGGSAEAAIDFVKKQGGKNIKFMCIIAAPEGLKRLHEAHPDVQIYCGSLDRELNENAYICPGLGDAGDRIFGTK